MSELTEASDAPPPPPPPPPETDQKSPSASPELKESLAEDGQDAQANGSKSELAGSAEHTDQPPADPVTDTSPAESPDRPADPGASELPRDDVSPDLRSAIADPSQSTDSVGDGAAPPESAPDEAMARALEQAGPAADQLRPYLQEYAPDGTADQGGGAEPPADSEQVGEVPDEVVAAEQPSEPVEAEPVESVEAGEPSQPVEAEQPSQPVEAGEPSQLEGEQPVDDELVPLENQQPAQPEERPQDEAVRRAQEQAAPVREDLQAYLKETAAGDSPGSDGGPGDGGDGDGGDDGDPGGTNSGDPRIGFGRNLGIPGQNPAPQVGEQPEDPVPSQTPNIPGRQRPGRGL